MLNKNGDWVTKTTPTISKRPDKHFGQFSLSPEYSTSFEELNKSVLTENDSRENDCDDRAGVDDTEGTRDWHEAFKSICSMSLLSLRVPGKSLLFPSTRMGIQDN